jgi:hypothetical protein
MIKRVTQVKPAWDALLLVEGGEGDGKTTMAACCAKYISDQTGRPYSHENVFFKIDDMVKFAQNTRGQIIEWDEPALEGLSAEWWKETQKNLVKLLMMARKNRHFFIFNITKFYKFPEYIIVDRALGLIHVYSRKNIEPGRFVYIRRKYIEWLFNDYRRNKMRNYRKYASIRGTFPDVLDKIIDIDAYNKNKDDAIMSIGVKEVKEGAKERKDMIIADERRRLAVRMKARGIIVTVSDGARVFGVDRSTFKGYLDPHGVENEAVEGTDIVNIGFKDEN